MAPALLRAPELVFSERAIPFGTVVIMPVALIVIAPEFIVAVDATLELKLRLPEIVVAPVTFNVAALTLPVTAAGRW